MAERLARDSGTIGCPLLFLKISIPAVDMAGLPGIPRAHARFEPGLGACTGASEGPRAPPEASVISKLHYRPALQRETGGEGAVPLKSP